MSQLEPGQYTGTIQGAGVSKSKNGTPDLYIDFDIDGNRRTVYIYCSDAAWKSGSREKLEALQFNGNFESPDFGVSEVDLVLRVEEYEGKMREKWDLANWGDSYQHPEADKKDVKKLNALWKKDTKPKKDAKPGATRDQAWAKFEKENGDKATPELWAELLKSLRPGKEEVKFTASDWQIVMEAVGVPF